jgi:hypothetical protein
MEAPNVEQEEKLSNDNETSIKGTLISVGLLGSVILITYLVVFGLYLTRV